MKDREIVEALELLSPANSSELAETWNLIRRHHIYQADAPSR